ncbi:MAG: thioredoxin domain-containing protein [Chloroflexota bacterium]|nr:thioredoxin domain-containing protein [Chloroflexota bacterium]
MSTSSVKKAQPDAVKPGANPQQTRGLVIIGAVVAVALVALVAVIALGGASSGAIDYTDIPSSRTSDGGFVLGFPEAPVTLVEFADFACPHCQAYHPTMQQFIREFVVTGKAKFEYRLMPTTGREVSLFTGKLLECAEELSPGSFWRGKDLMYTYATSGRYNADIGRQFAQDIGVSYSDMLECSANAQQVTIDANLANTLSVQGTPAVMVRYDDSSTPVFVTVGTTTYDRGGAPFTALASMVNAANPS